MVKNSPANAGDVGSVPKLGISPREGDGNPIHCSCPGKFHGERSLAGYSAWSCRVGHNSATEKACTHE